MRPKEELMSEAQSAFGGHAESKGNLLFVELLTDIRDALVERNIRLRDKTNITNKK